MRIMSALIDRLSLGFWTAAILKDNAEKHLGLVERQRCKV
jgi:hypothetical protein